MPNKKKTMSPNAPRLDPHQRILSRFYEPLILLCTLGRTRKEHRPADFPRSADITSWPLQYVRRLFLNQLAFLCDYVTGGDSVTAISIQHTPQQRIFWIAANICPSKKIEPFVHDCLTLLKHVAESRATIDEAIDPFLATCIDHSKPRIRAYSRFFTRELKACRENLEIKAVEDKTYKLLLVWLKTFQSRNVALEELCKLAYSSRRCEEMRILTSLCGEAHSQPERNSLQARCRLLRHYIGRLGQYVKIVKTLLVSAPRLLDMLDNVKICCVSLPARMQRPPSADGKTNLDSIAKRMLPAQSPDLTRYQLALSEMDTRFGITAKYMEIYYDDNFKPRVHAEVQILDFFHNNNLKFEESDIFVACSKPACYCCSLYFRHHPLRPVTPASHQTIHKNWRPPDFVPGNNTQRDILNKMIEDVRTEALYQIDQKRPNAQWHPDSTTGITESISHLFEQESLEHLSEASDLSEVLNISSEASSLSFDEETEGQDSTSPNELDELDSSHIKPNLSSDWEEDSDESGGVLLPFGSDIVADDEDFWNHVSRHRETIAKAPAGSCQ